MDRLIHSLQSIPGVGPKSAARIALYLVHKNRNAGIDLTESLSVATEVVKSCTVCRNISDSDVCRVCDNPKRDDSVLCIVESPADALAIEQTGHYRGLYFVLHGHLSPIDGIGPNDLGLNLLQARAHTQNINEIIIATSTSPEGEATAHYIASMLNEQEVLITRIAHGVPVGGQLEYSDSSTIHHALRGRTVLGS